MIELTLEDCKAVSGGSGYLVSTGKTGDATTSTDRSGYISSTGRSGYISSTGRSDDTGTA
jgi:hypothetical protein